GGEKELPPPAPIDITTRALQSPELAPPAIDPPFVHRLPMPDPNPRHREDEDVSSPHQDII
ncbi:MAG TPA: hypothetical protein VG205_04235, partial [Acidimicrobiales bacterium]|nr:hypothetical protein [Acidimicrobiales bacterium]